MENQIIRVNITSGVLKNSGILKENPPASIVETPNALWTAVWYRSCGLKTTESKNHSGILPDKKDSIEPPDASKIANITVPYINPQKNITNPPAIEVMRLLQNADMQIDKLR